MSAYTPEMLEKLGEVYHKLLWIKDKDNGKDPYVQISDILPYKCFVMVLPRTIAMGIPEYLHKEIAELMDMISVDDSQTLMTAQVPMELRIYWHKGYQKIYARSLV